MLVEHRGARPAVDPSAYVAPTAVLCGDVHVGPDARILFGAVVTAEDGRIEIGARCVVMENALLRARAAHPVRLGDDVLVGPHAHLSAWTSPRPSMGRSARRAPASAWSARPRGSPPTQAIACSIAPRPSTSTRTTSPGWR
jgi:acetyltransferase-like isoleucine patch superfamily enzyme